MSTIARSLIAAALIAGAVLATASSAAALGPPLAFRPVERSPNYVPQGSAPYAGMPNYAHTAPAFRWGWFGAESFTPPVRWHRGYYGDHYRWNRR
ncbi:MAG: hypothetical protein AAGJ46_21405 [Planctomycetota bacterium]